MSMDAFYLQDTRSLVDCAMGRLPAEMVIRDGVWVCVQSGEFIAHSDVAIIDGRVAFVGPDAGHTIGSETLVIDAKGRYLVPGLLDGHMHVESGMTTVTGFVRAVMARGTTAMFIDPHEIANVFGLRGVRLMVDEAGVQPIHVFVQMPSCVPSAPGLETPGAVIGPVEVAEAMTWPGIIGLGEMMNFPGVYFGDDKVHAELTVTRRARKVIGGHYASLDIGLPFHGYAAGGAQDDHEGTRLEDALARVRQGMRVSLRYGSAWHDVAAQVKAVTEMGLDSRNFFLCTDDSHMHTLMTEGHMDRVIRHAIEQGLNPMVALQMATINTAEHFGVSREIGMIAPGRHADIVLVNDLKDFRAEMVIVRGRKVAEHGKIIIPMPQMDYPDWVLHSVHIPRKLTAQDFRLAASIEKGEVLAHVIGILENQAPTRHLQIKLPVVGGEVRADREKDIAKVALVERHHNSGRIQTGLVKGFGFDQSCAVATTVAHDSHQVIIVGTDETQMALAVNALAECGGGQVVVQDGRVIGQVELPIAGLMSNQPGEVIVEKAETVLQGFRSCGCRLNNPNMQLSLLGLVVIPELRISDLGVVDVEKFDFIQVLEDLA